MYDVVIPRINNYTDELLTPSYFPTVKDSNILVMENLTALGYEKGQNIRQLYSFNQCLPVLKALAHFHAATHKIAQMDQNLLNNEIFQYPTLFDFKLKSVDLWEPIFYELLARDDASFLIPKFKKAVLYLRQNYEDIKLKFHYSNFKFLVVNHGDFRYDNVLLKNGQNGAVDGVKIIDFQTCFWSTPANDFMYFLITSAGADSINNHYETFLNSYLEYLNKKLKQLNCIQEYGKQDFVEDVKYLRIHNIFHITIAAVLLCPKDRDQLVQTIVRGKKENIQYYREVCLNDQLFTNTILSILKFLDKLGLFEF